MNRSLSMSQMFCFQCEQTAGGKACTGSRGVCGKMADTSNLLDDMTGALIALAKVSKGKERKPSTDFIMLEGLFTAITNVNFNNETIDAIIRRITTEQEAYGSVTTYTMSDLWQDQKTSVHEVPDTPRITWHGRLCLSRMGTLIQR